MGLLSKLYYLTGLFSLFAIPSYKGFLLVHIFLLTSLYFTLFILFLKVPNQKLKLSKNEIILVNLAFLLYISSIIGAMLSDVISGILFSQIFIITFITVSLAFKINKNLIKSLLKGFVASSILTSLYIILQSVFFYLYSINLTTVIFPEVLLEKANEHTFTNFININGLIFFRSPGFSWDPALTATALIFSIILITENIVFVKRFKLFMIVVLTIGIFLSVSKVSIISLFIYWTAKILRLHRLKLILGSYKIHLLSLATFLTFLILLYIGFFFKYTSDAEGDIRHIKYFSSLFYYFYQSIPEILFGYGYRGSGEFFNKYVEWFNSVPGFLFDKGSAPESTLTYIFLVGGLCGSFFWIFTYIYAFIKGGKEIKILLFTMLLVTFGNTINSVWFVMLYLSIFYISSSYYREEI